MFDITLLHIHSNEDGIPVIDFPFIFHCIVIDTFILSELLAYVCQVVVVDELKFKSLGTRVHTEGNQFGLLYVSQDEEELHEPVLPSLYTI
ncbi:MAG: hypothetical protein LBC61_07525 [Candidatus Peribacteria bacterium]|jgi:hypothetical protein|nr:hypothetical protein [Candidatus Peribacteria bacterium]